MKSLKNANDFYKIFILLILFEIQRVFKINISAIRYWKSVVIEEKQRCRMIHFSLTLALCYIGSCRWGHPVFACKLIEKLNNVQALYTYFAQNSQACLYLFICILLKWLSLLFVERAGNNIYRSLIINYLQFRENLNFKWSRYWHVSQCILQLINYFIIKLNLHNVSVISS